jgi:hypothetical protein
LGIKRPLSPPENLRGSNLKYKLISISFCNDAIMATLDATIPNLYNWNNTARPKHLFLNVENG